MLPLRQVFLVITGFWLYPSWLYLNINIKDSIEKAGAK